MARWLFVAVCVLMSNGLMWFPGVAIGGETTQLPAHEHGQGVLNVAIEESRVDLMLEIPAHDVVGFEYIAQTDEEKSLVARAKLLLRDPLKVFGPDAAAECEMTASDVHFTNEGSEHPEDGDHDDLDKGGEHGDHDHDDGHHGDDDHAHDGGHSEVHASYSLECGAPAKLSAFRLTFFELFSRAERIDVNIVSDAGQVQSEATRDKPDVVIPDGA